MCSPDNIHILIYPSFERVPCRIWVHFRNGVVMHSSIDRELFNSCWDEKATGVVSDNLELQHTVHESDPVVDPTDTTTGTLNVAADNSTEKTTVGTERNEKQRKN